MGLLYDDATHRYRLDGRPVPNVTTIINGGLPKPALVDWAARVVAEYVADHADDMPNVARAGRAPMVAYLSQLHTEARNVAGARGTLVHSFADALAHGQQVDIPPEYGPYVYGYVDFLDAHNVRTLYTERPVANRDLWYAGRFDLIAEIDRETWLIDVKTAKGVYGDTSLQLAAYASAEFLNDPDNAETPMPRIDRIGVAHVTTQGTDLYDMGDIAAAFDEFRSAAHIYRTARRRRNLVGEPLAPLPEVLA